MGGVVEHHSWAAGLSVQSPAIVLVASQCWLVVLESVRTLHSCVESKHTSLGPVGSAHRTCTPPLENLIWTGRPATIYAQRLEQCFPKLRVATHDWEAKLGYFPLRDKYKMS